MLRSRRALLNKLEEWKRELDISWDVEVEIVSAAELKGDHGRVVLTEGKRCALILLLDPREANPDEMRPYDMELALVHELVHVMLAPFQGSRRGDHKDIVMEQCVHATSKALLKFQRVAQKGHKCSSQTRPTSNRATSNQSTAASPTSPPPKK